MARNCCERDPCDDGFDSVIRVPERDHSKLENRDAEDAHPIKAITNLQFELTQKMNAHDALTNIEILEILGGI